jgi:hypothetical protein
MNLKFEYSISDEYKELVRDIIKFSTILIVLNLLMFLTNPADNTFLGQAFVTFMIYIILGIVTYWLVVSKVILLD